MNTAWAVTCCFQKNPATHLNAVAVLEAFHMSQPLRKPAIDAHSHLIFIEDLYV
jgi:hypothetical protein